MLRYVLTPHMDENLSPSQQMALHEKCRQIEVGDYHQRAAKMSRLVGVTRVTVTCVTEHSLGVWRAGKKS